jgi:hypothetical protein
MILAYRDKQDVDILISKDENAQRKHLFDTYIERMFERPRLKNAPFQKQEVLDWLSWLAQNMIEQNAVPYFLENIQPNWLRQENRLKQYRRICGQVLGITFGLVLTITQLFSAKLNTERSNAIVFGCFFLVGIRIFAGTFFEPNSNLRSMLTPILPNIHIRSIDEIVMVDSLSYTWRNARKNLELWILFSGLVAVLLGLTITFMRGYDGLRVGLHDGLLAGLTLGIIVLAGKLFFGGVSIQQVDQTTYPEQRLVFTRNNFLIIFLAT